MIIDMYPAVEVYKTTARASRRKGDTVNVWLIKYDGQIHEGGWAKKESAYAYADKLVNGEVEPKLLPREVEV